MNNKELTLAAGDVEKELMAHSAHFGAENGQNGILCILEQNKVNWKVFIDLLRIHGVFPIVYERLSQYKELIPEDVWGNMRMVNMSLTMLTLKKYAFVREMAQVLHSSGVRACLIKGALLSSQIYGKPTYRDFYDIDILISEKDYRKVVDILLGKGYSPARDECLKLDGFEAVRYAHYREQIRFVKDGFLNIELHFRLMNIGNPTPNEDYVWSACKLEEYDGCSFWVLAPEDTLLFLITHGVQHRFSRFSLITDIMGFYVKFFSSFSLNRFQNTVEYCRADKALRHTEVIISFFYGGFGGFFSSETEQNGGCLRMSCGMRIVSELVLAQRKIKNLKNKAFPQKFEAPLFFIFFTSGRKIFFIKNVFYFAYKY